MSNPVMNRSWQPWARYRYARLHTIFAASLMMSVLAIAEHREGVTLKGTHDALGGSGIPVADTAIRGSAPQRCHLRLLPRWLYALAWSPLDFYLQRRPCAVLRLFVWPVRRSPLDNPQGQAKTIYHLVFCSVVARASDHQV